MFFVKLTKTFKVSGSSSQEQFDHHTDHVMDELVALENDHISDADVSVNLRDRIVEISLVAGAEDFDAAAQLADSCIRSAIHAAGGGTPDWSAIESTSKQLVAA